MPRKIYFTLSDVAVQDIIKNTLVNNLFQGTDEEGNPIITNPNDPNYDPEKDKSIFTQDENGNIILRLEKVSETIFIKNEDGTYSIDLSTATTTNIFKKDQEGNVYLDLTEVSNIFTTDPDTGEQILKLSEEEGNLLELKDDGYYVSLNDKDTAEKIRFKIDAFYKNTIDPETNMNIFTDIVYMSVDRYIFVIDKDNRTIEQRHNQKYLNDDQKKEYIDLQEAGALDEFDWEPGVNDNTNVVEEKADARLYDLSRHIVYWNGKGDAAGNFVDWGLWIGEKGEPGLVDTNDQTKVDELATSLYGKPYRILPFIYESEEPESGEIEIKHNLNTQNLKYEFYIYNDNTYNNSLIDIIIVDNNTIKINLPIERKIKLILLGLKDIDNNSEEEENSEEENS